MFKTLRRVITFFFVEKIQNVHGLGCCIVCWLELANLGFLGKLNIQVSLRIVIFFQHIHFYY